MSIKREELFNLDSGDMSVIELEIQLFILLPFANSMFFFDETKKITLTIYI